ncbi:putative PEP-binding protein [Dietzia sp.]|uniref:putative PEP-binding protein n=1 Tax=Dietzia sp. TaxID=1871616 RepID=UPI002FD92390
MSDSNSEASSGSQQGQAPGDRWDYGDLGEREWNGTGVVGGIAYAPVVRVRRESIEVETDPDPALAAEDAEERREAEKTRLAAAAGAVADRLMARAQSSTGSSSEVLAANAQLARDRGWLKEAGKHVAKGVRAEGAAKLVTEKFVAMFAKLGGRQAERITDLEDINARVLAELLGIPEPGVPEISTHSVLAAADLAPADTAGLDAGSVRAIVTEFGGPTSHTSIIARQLGIPCVVAVAGLGELREGAAVLVDGSTGTIRVGVDPAEAESRARADAELRARAAEWTGPAELADGTPVDLLANVQDGESARRAAQGPAQGIGLFRTELAFLDRPEEPSVDEQAEMYAEVLEAFPGKKVVIRTLDAGSDKPVSFAGLPEEDNPALGVRGLRLDLLDRGLLDRQLDGLAEAAKRLPTGSPVQVMAPMVATVSEAEDFAARCRDRGLSPGIMIEIPAAAVAIDKFLPIVDFVSIGTNDLTQYTMAADRMSPHLATLTDPWQPAVLALVAHVARAAEARAAGGGSRVPVGVCGEAAADPYLAIVLKGFGVTSLSAAAAAVPFVGAKLAEVTEETCAAAAEAALAANSAREAKAAVIALVEGE